MRNVGWAGVVAALGCWAGAGRADVAVTVDRAAGRQATPAYAFAKVPPPAAGDLAEKARFTFEGEPDPNGGGLDVLHDGKGAANRDDPAGNFFASGRSAAGRLLVDLGEAREIGQVRTYSWHTGARTPQVYRLYAAEGTEDGFLADPKAYIDPEKAGWTFLTSVDTRASARGRGNRGGQHAASIAEDDGAPLGTFRYLLLDIAPTEPDDLNGQTFFSEVDVVAPDPNAPARPAGPRYRIVVDTAGLSPEMAAWAEAKLKPVCREWYPKIVAMLPSEGYTAPRTFTIVFPREMDVPAAAAGTKVMCNAPWFEKNRDGEAIGAVVHEMVHVVQQYPWGRRPVPNWLQEGIPDYIRWFLYEPQTQGARVRNPDRVRYDNSYRVSGNFLDWATRTYDKDLVRKLNAAVRQGTYADAMWKDLAGGKDLDALDKEWKASLAKP